MKLNVVHLRRIKNAIGNSTMQELPVLLAHRTGRFHVLRKDRRAGTDVVPTMPIYATASVA